MILLDTNILVRLVAVTDPAHSVVETAIHILEQTREILCIIPQNLFEFWAVGTRPLNNNGLGLTATECHRELARFKTFFWLLPDPPTLYDEWESLVVSHACHGRISYDARIVAAMRSHGITKLLTLNSSDFSRYPGLTLLDPARIVASTAAP